MMQRVIRDTGWPIVSDQGALAPLIAVAAWLDEWDECDPNGMPMLQEPVLGSRANTKGMMLDDTN